MSREKDRHKSHYSRERDRERDRSTERDRHVGSERHDSSSRRSEHKDRRDRDRDRDRERDGEKDRARHRDRDRHRSSRDRSRSRSRSRERDRSKHDRDRKSGEGSRRQSDTQQQQQQQQPPQGQVEQQQQQAANGLTAEQQADAHKKKREAEQTALDEEMEERRKRVEEWRKKRAAEAAAAAAAEQQRKQEEEEAAAAAAAAAEVEAASNKKGWSLEDDEDDEDHQQQADGDEVDPLDAFMAGNAAAVAPAMQQEQQQQQDVLMADADAPDTSQAAEAAAAAAAVEEDEVDPLDAFMAAEVLPEVRQVRFTQPPAAAAAPKADAEAAGADSSKAGAMPGSSGGRKGSMTSKSAKSKQKQRRTYYDTSSESDWTDSEEEGPAEEAELDDETWAKNVTAGKLSKGEKLAAVDHAAMDYPHFRRRFYIEVPEIQRMTEEEVNAARKTEGVKVRGTDIPRPVKTWTQCGINVKVLEVLRKHGFERPLSIQAQALPIIMSGRDCIGIAKTGSGKTLAFVLPMIRHIRDQSELRDGDGPIALIMAPTRELVQQIAKEVKRFGSPMMISCTAVFGGAGVANQISELKRGTEVIAATPGRLIDLLVSRVTNLRRVTYLVLDEADRMFDMGFEPQITRIVNNIRPDRQTVMFSATFPRAVETLARQILNNPVEIQVGGRSVVNADIAQFVEIRPEADRFLRLLEILGEWYEVGKIIIFVHTQDNCDNLFRDLLKAGYPCLSLHGGKEQSDRECTIADFKGAVCNILVATSIAARGLDVRDLVLVVNYDVPNHHEDYVHRVGRTGRAGNKGTAITFIGPDEDRYAPDLVKALKESGAVVPQDLQALADTFATKRKHGLVQGHGSGYGGSGFKFDKAEDAKVKQARKSKAKEFGIVGNDEEEEAPESEDDDIRPSTQGQQQQQPAAPGIVVTPAAAAAVAAAINGPAATPGLPGAPKFLPAQPGQQFPGQAVAQAPSALVAAATAAAAQVSGVTPAAAQVPASSSLAAAQAAAMRAAALAAAYAQGGGAPTAPAAAPAAAVTAPVRAAGFETEIEINDFPQNARWKVTHKGFQQDITDMTGAAVTTKGIYVAQGAQPPEGERKLYLLIEGPTEAKVRQAKQEIRRVIEELVEKAMRRDVGAAGSRRYNIM